MLLLGARGTHRAEWRVADALAVGLRPSKANQPFRVGDVVSVDVRAARFREEAFYGPDTEIVVVTAERSVTEFCVPPEEVDEVALRLDAAADDPPTQDPPAEDPTAQDPPETD